MGQSICLLCSYPLVYISITIVLYCCYVVPLCVDKIIYIPHHQLTDSWAVCSPETFINEASRNINSQVINSKIFVCIYVFMFLGVNTLVQADWVVSVCLLLKTPGVFKTDCSMLDSRQPHQHMSSSAFLCTQCGQIFWIWDVADYMIESSLGFKIPSLYHQKC